MKAMATVVLIIGVASLVGGLIVRVMAIKQLALGLIPSSFLEFSIACFLLTLALDAISKK